MTTITIQQPPSQTQSTAGWLARTSLLATTRTAGVFVGSNFLSGFCHVHLPSLVHNINQAIATSLGLNPTFGSFVSYMGIGYGYNYADQIIRSVGGAAGYYTADVTTNAALYVFDRLTTRAPSPKPFAPASREDIRSSWKAKLPKGKETMPRAIQYGSEIKK